MNPKALLEVGRAEVRGYGGHIVDGCVTSASRDGDSFTVTLADGRVVTARRLLVTTGLIDELPEVSGLRERWGRDVLHCPYCHGWEVRDLRHQARVRVAAPDPVSRSVASVPELLGKQIQIIRSGVRSVNIAHDTLAVTGVAAAERWSR